jgi:hypothetical protein
MRSTAVKKRIFLAVGVVCLVALNAVAQGVDDLFAGKLVNPKVGQWAWYDIADAQGGNKHAIRQAVVGQEKVAGKTGHWVEFELVPPAGYPVIYKMLVTGPASDPANVHRIVVKQGTEPARSVPVKEVFAKPQAAKPPRQPAGEDEIATAGGPVKAKRYTVRSGQGEVQIWVNEEVPPTGIVRVKSPDGEMVLREYGMGGSAGESALPEDGRSSDTKVSVEVGKEGKKGSRKGKRP